MGERQETPEQEPQIWQIQTFGGFAITPNNPQFRTRKTESLVILLGIRPGTTYSRDAIADIFWPGDKVDSARQSVRMAISNIRQVLGPDTLITHRDEVSLNPDRIQSDLAKFEDHILQAQQTQPKSLGSRAMAAEIASKPWLPAILDDWATGQSHGIYDQVSENALKLIKLYRASDQFNEGIRLAKQTLSVVGFQEELHIALMQLYVAAGLTSLAIAQFEQLETELDDLWGEPPSPAALAVLKNLPQIKTRAPQTPGEPPIHGLFGRRAEYEQILQQLEDSPGQIITILGTGGTGKTALARAIEQTHREQDRPVFFIDLTSETTPAAAAERTRKTLKVRALESAESFPAVTRFIQQNPGLYIFDNLEQLKEHSLSFFSKILTESTESKLLATSRIAIGHEREQLIQLHPLQHPEANKSLDSIRKTSAIQLFEQVAKQADPNFRITTQNAQATVELCRRLDGLPLAIKLAGARTVIRTPAQILASIQSDLSHISSNSKDLPDRHSNLHRTVEWSYNLLSNGARSVAETLSFHTGPFDEALAEQIIQRPCHDQIEELVKASVLNANSHDEVTEFFFYETVRQSLQAIATQNGHTDAIMDRFIDFAHARFDEISQDTSLDASQTTKLHYERIEDYSTCLEYGFENPALDLRIVDLALKVQAATGSFEYTRTRHILKRYWEWPTKEIPDSLRARCGSEYGRSLANIGDPQAIREILVKCHELAKGDKEATIAVRYHLSTNFKVLGEYEKAIEEVDWVLKNTSKLDDQSLAQYYYRQGLNYGCLNQRERCFEFFSKALTHIRRARDTNNLVRILFDLGSEYAFKQDSENAIKCFLEAEAICQSVGSTKLEGLTRWQHGDALFDLGRLEEAFDQLNLSIQLVYAADYKAAEKWIYIKAAQVALSLNHEHLAAKLLAKGRHARESESRMLAVYEEEYSQATVQKILEKMTSEEFTAVSFSGRESTWEQLWDEFRSIRPTQPPSPNPH